jgi:hypothetical protein
MRRLLRLLQSQSSPRNAIFSAFALCGLYFASWYIISHCLSFGSLNF